MNRQTERQPAAVPQAQQAGAAEAVKGHPLWLSAKPCVWTTRMLTTLIEGVEGGKWFRLFDKVFLMRNLHAAFQQVAKNRGAPGVDHVTTQAYATRLPDELLELSQRLQDGTYQPQAIKRVHIPKPGSTETRPLGIPTVQDRVVQAAVVNVIEPIFERDFAEQSYGFRPQRSCKDALRRVDDLLQAGYCYVVDADLKGYFDSIPHDRLMERLEDKIADGSLLSLIDQFLQTNILDGVKEWTPTAGAPQGAVLSPMLSNVYLDPLDQQMAAAGYQMVRYADDFVILCRTAQEAAQALEEVQAWTATNGLTLHPTKTQLVDSRTEGFDFLGYHFRGTKHWPRDKSVKKVKEAIRAKTKRNSGRSLQCTIADVNRTLRGWFEYFKHTSRHQFRPIDCFVRQRIRAILRKRHKRRGIAKGLDFKRWPNAFFAEQGLFSLVTAHAEACQSSPRLHHQPESRVRENRTHGSEGGGAG